MGGTGTATLFLLVSTCLQSNSRRWQLWWQPITVNKALVYGSYPWIVILIIVKISLLVFENLRCLGSRSSNCVSSWNGLTTHETRIAMVLTHFPFRVMKAGKIPSHQLKVEIPGRHGSDMRMWETACGNGGRKWGARHMRKHVEFHQKNLQNDRPQKEKAKKQINRTWSHLQRWRSYSGRMVCPQRMDSLHQALIFGKMLQQTKAMTKLLRDSHTYCFAGLPSKLAITIVKS